MKRTMVVKEGFGSLHDTKIKNTKVRQQDVGIYNEVYSAIN